MPRQDLYTIDVDRRRETGSSQLDSSNNRFTILSRITDNIFCYNLNNEDILREVTVKIGLERIDTQKGIIIEMLLDSEATELVMSSEFARVEV